MWSLQPSTCRLAAAANHFSRERIDGFCAGRIESQQQLIQDDVVQHSNARDIPWLASDGIRGNPRLYLFCTRTQAF